MIIVNNLRINKKIFLLFRNIKKINLLEMIKIYRYIYLDRKESLELLKKQNFF